MTVSSSFINFFHILINNNNLTFEFENLSCQDLKEILLFLASNHGSVGGINFNKKLLLQVLKKILDDLDKRSLLGSPTVVAEEEEIVEELREVAYELAGALCMPAAHSCSSATLEKIYFMPNDYSVQGALILTEEVAIISAGTTGLSTWNASLWLLEYLSSPSAQHLVKGKRVLELGSGCGLLGLALAKSLGAESVLLTDCDYAVLERLKKNKVRNGFDAADEDVVRIEKWDWFERASYSSSKQDEFDLLIAADVVFDPSLIEPLVATIAATRSLSCLIACTERVKETFAMFTKHLSKAGLEFTITSSLPGKTSSTWFYYREKSPVHLVEIHRGQ